MSIITEQNLTNETLLQVAKLMVVAARTAPKGRGRNTLECIIVTGPEIIKLSNKMTEIGKAHNAGFFLRDAKNIVESEAIVIIGTKINSLGLNELCTYCGFNNCNEKDQHAEIPCIYNIGDLHLALGSAAVVAANHFIDNRIMFSVGKAAIEENLFDSEIKIAMGIPLASKSKNPFFDRA